MAAFQSCPDCAKKGITSPVVPRRITETVAIWKCRNKDCIYPMSQSLDFFKSQFVPINSIDERLFSNYVSHEFRTPSCNSEAASGNSFSVSDPIQTRLSPLSKIPTLDTTTSLSKAILPADRCHIHYYNDSVNQLDASFLSSFSPLNNAQAIVPQSGTIGNTNKVSNSKSKSIGTVSASSRTEAAKTTSIDVTSRLKRKYDELSERTSAVSEAGMMPSRPSSRPSRTPMDLQTMLKRIKRVPDTKGLNKKSNTSQVSDNDRSIPNLDKVYIRPAKLSKNLLASDNHVTKAKEPRFNKPVTLYCSSQPFPGYSSNGNSKKDLVDCGSEDGSSSAGGASDTNSVKFSSAVRKTLRTNIVASIQQNSSPAMVVTPQLNSQQFAASQPSNQMTLNSTALELPNNVGFPPFVNPMSNIPSLNDNFDLFNDTPPFLSLSNFWAGNQQAQQQVVNSDFSAIIDPSSNRYPLSFDTHSEFMSDFLDNNMPLNNVYEQL